MRDLLLALVLFGAVPFILLRAHLGVYAWAWLSYMNPHRLTWGFAFSFPFNQMIALVTAAAWLFARRPKRFPWTPATVLWLAFVAWTSVATLLAIDPAHSAVEWQRFMKIQLMILFTLLLIDTPERLRALVWVIVLSLGFYGVKGGLYTLATGGRHIVWGPPYSFISGNNEIAFALCICLPLMVWCARVGRGWRRWASAAMAGLTAVAVLGSYSRGAFLTLGAMGAALCLKSDRRLPIAAGLVALAVAAFLWMPEAYRARLGTILEYRQDGSAMGRLNAWAFAINLAAERPVTGGGFDTFREPLFARWAPDPKDFHDAHSIYFEVLAEQGYVGLLLFLALAAVTFLGLRRVERAAAARPGWEWARHLAAMMQVSLVGYGVGGAFLGLAYWDLPYHFIAIAVILQGLLRAAPAPVPPAATAAVPNPWGRSPVAGGRRG
ncbi:MAG: O-antigen polymerase [Gammaproteobacteria bacterium]|nr:MAG: O-antigen polymerase [Gammaproteobacteria bacterium]